MSEQNQQDIPKAYNTQDWEDKLYAEWEESGFFNPDTCIEKGVTKPDAEPFSIVLPPPNVTGTLHTGSACMLAIEDLIVRFKRMQGYRTLWIPGTDHAAIATQSKVEKIISKEEGKTRHDLGREELLRRIETFAKQSHDTIVHQTKKLGSSLDWSREAFTLDEARNKSVRAAFKKMYDEGIIYRGYRTVNWSTKGQSTSSDDEVVYQTRPAKLYTFRYSKDFPIAIATTRPETKLGDTAVAVHPDDKRYKKYVGKTFEIESFAGGPKLSIKIIADTMVDPAFGTGAVGITPAHSHADYDFFVRHKDVVAFAPAGEPVIGTDGKITAAGSPAYAGLLIEDAREKVIAVLKEQGLFEKEEDIVQNVGTSDRFGDIIEVLPMKQWFIDVNKSFECNSKQETLKSLMQQAVRSGNIRILPERFEKHYFHWVDNLRDWCISRQIWYGHRIPVWYCLSCKQERVDATVRSRWFFVRHGETDWNKAGRLQGNSDIPLNETGRRQASQVAGFLHNQSIGIIFSSHLARAKETAEIINRDIGAKIVVDERLREREMGVVEGRSIASIKQEYPNLYHYTDKSAGNESYEEMEQRMWEAVSEHLGAHSRTNIVIVSHGAALRALFRRIKNVDPDVIMTIGKVPNAQPISVDILDPCERCDGHFFEQENDTLDTWFSSGLWTFSTLGWGSDEKQWKLQKIYHPTSLLETGYDILPFWVARMILMSTYLLGEVPFRTVYLHGLVRDEEGRKMSKSLDNIIDPLDVIEKYGADALRLALIIGSTPGNDLKLSDAKIESFRNFTNKLWNIGRYVAGNKEQETSDRSTDQKESLADRWILTRLQETTMEVTRLLEHYQLSLAGEKLRDFTWNEFADWYIEIHKVEKNDAVLRRVFETLLRLWHPFMPYVTEALWRTLRPDTASFLMTVPWPSPGTVTNDAAGIARFQDLLGLISRIRALRALYRIDPKTPVPIATHGDSLDVLHANAALFKRLARVKEIASVDRAPRHSALVQSGLLQTYVMLEKLIDIPSEIVRLEKERTGLVRYASSLSAQLSNEAFVRNAKPDIVRNTQTKLAETKRKITELEASLDTLKR